MRNQDSPAALPGQDHAPDIIVPNDVMQAIETLVEEFLRAGLGPRLRHFYGEAKADPDTMSEAEIEAALGDDEYRRAHYNQGLALEEAADAWHVWRNSAVDDEAEGDGEF